MNPEESRDRMPEQWSRAIAACLVVSTLHGKLLLLHASKSTFIVCLQGLAEGSFAMRAQGSTLEKKEEKIQ